MAFIIYRQPILASAIIANHSNRRMNRREEAAMMTFHLFIEKVALPMTIVAVTIC